MRRVGGNDTEGTYDESISKTGCGYVDGALENVFEGGISCIILVGVIRDIGIGRECVHITININGQMLGKMRSYSRT